MKSVLSAPPTPDDPAANTPLFSWAAEPEHGRLAVDSAPGAGGILVVRISGDIDVTTLPSFGSHLEEAIDDRLPFVLDLSDVQFLCASRCRFWRSCPPARTGSPCRGRSPGTTLSAGR